MADRPVLFDLARFLRQREELGAGSFAFESLSRDEIARLLREGRARGRATEGSREEAGDTDLTRPVRKPSGPSEITAASDPVDLPSDHGPLRELALGCVRCPLSEGRTQVVFHDGSPDARLMVVGEAPGANEDASGVPFVGAAGKYLDLLMASVGLSRRESVYICNVIKCRPPGNRNPKPDEISACSPWLKRQIEVVKPEVILAVGTFSAQLLTGKDIALGRLRGEIYSYEGTPLVVTYHPAALLRNSRWTRPCWEDFQLLRRVMDGAPT
ncbi:MAG: uracil-DNA glycosylase [Gemmatimonadales bacterium]|nr:MAG: uracil-DNA glycosylase [Gemmatimonadales bacterium]